MKKFLLVLFVLLLTIPTFAQTDNEIAAIMVDSVNLQIITVYEDGSDRVLGLPITQEAHTSSSFMTISHDAQYAGICYGVNDTNTNKYFFMVLDLTDNTILFEEDLGQIQICQAMAFDADASRVAVAKIIEAPVYDNSSEAVWALDVYNTQTGEIINSLGSRDIISAEFINFESTPPILAHVRKFDSDSITFAAIPFVGMGGIADVPAFTWSLADDSIVVADAIMGNLLSNINPITGEIAYPNLNEAFDAAVPDGPMPQANEIILMEDDAEQVIYRNTEWVISQAYFVNNGNSLAVFTIENANNDDMITEQRIALVQRDGSLLTLGAYDFYIQIGNWSNGTLVLSAEQPTGAATPKGHISLFDSQGNGDEIWTYQTGIGERGFAFLELIWTQPITEADPMGNFQPVN